MFVPILQKKFKKLSDNIFTKERSDNGLVVLGFAKFWWQYKILIFYKSEAGWKSEIRKDDEPEHLFENNSHLLVICWLLVKDEHAGKKNKYSFVDLRIRVAKKTFKFLLYS